MSVQAPPPPDHMYTSYSLVPEHTYIITIKYLLVMARAESRTEQEPGGVDNLVAAVQTGFRKKSVDNSDSFARL